MSGATAAGVWVKHLWRPPRRDVVPTRRSSLFLDCERIGRAAIGPNEGGIETGSVNVEDERPEVSQGYEIGRMRKIPRGLGATDLAGGTREGVNRALVSAAIERFQVSAVTSGAS